ncbi:MAG: DUF378 domain-containing protein [Clostridiales bacterium]|jgi:uncharacterized membrane protein YuzA (DUF378 family)|nr:DUF378 domain-containing protein [Clostridiales bacterium]
MRSKPLDWTALTLVIIGAINWGLIGFFKLDLIATLFGGMESWLSRIVYAAIGLAGLYCLSLYGRTSQDSHTEYQSQNNDQYQDVVRHDQ